MFELRFILSFLTLFQDLNLITTDLKKNTDRKSRMVNEDRVRAISKVRNSLKSLDDLQEDIVWQQRDGSIAGYMVFDSKRNIKDMLTKQVGKTGLGVSFEFSSVGTTLQRVRKYISGILNNWAKDMDDLAALTTVHSVPGWMDIRDNFFHDDNKDKVASITSDLSIATKGAKGAQKMVQWKGLFELVNGDNYGAFFAPEQLQKWQQIMSAAADFYNFSIMARKIAVEIPAIRNKPNRQVEAKKLLEGGQVYGASLTSRLELLAQGHLPEGYAVAADAEALDD